MIGLWLYLSTTIFIGPPLMLLAMLAALFRLYKNKSLIQLSTFDLNIFNFLLLMSLGAVFLFVIGSQYASTISKGYLSIFPYFTFLLASFFIARMMNAVDLKVISILIAIEIVVGCIEYQSGVRTFFPEYIKGQTAFGETDLMYYNRVYGLSANSSALSLKSLWLVVIALYFNRTKVEVGTLRSTFSLLIFAISLIGLIISFNRTAIVASTAGILYHFNKKYLAAFLILLAIVVLIFGSSIFSPMSVQFNRGMDETDTSERDWVFLEYLNYIGENPLAGNFGSKLWIERAGEIYHAHNSFLQTLASNGLILGGLMVLFIFYAVYKVPLLIPIFIYSLLQFGILWGLSFSDVLFFYLLSNCGNYKNHFRPLYAK